MISWLKSIFGKLRSEPAPVDVLPPDTRIGRGLAPDLLPAEDRTIPPKTTRSAKSASADDPTEELLILTEDAIEKLEGQGFDPYNQN
ncbi:MAG: hypothetical protein AAFU66_02855 [Pseudomonadota bacterium]